MGYTVKGNFSASLCLDFLEAVSDTRIRIYRGGNTTRKNPESGKKKTIRILTQKEILDKEDRLIGKGRTDSEGNYEIELSDAYQDGPIAIDLKLNSLARQKRTNKKPVQFTVRELTPIWRNASYGLYYSWNYCFPFEFWSQIRTIFDAWTICGHIKSAKNAAKPLSGATVSAFDVDWIKDDVLGNGITDDKGFFRIDFDSSDFKRTFLSPIINIETPISSIPGPGIYFKVTAEDGSIVYEENRAEGQTEERKHIPRCYCVDLYLSDAKNKYNS